MIMSMSIYNRASKMLEKPQNFIETTQTTGFITSRGLTKFISSVPQSTCVSKIKRTSHWHFYDERYLVFDAHLK